MGAVIVCLFYSTRQCILKASEMCVCGGGGGGGRGGGGCRAGGALSHNFKAIDFKMFKHDLTIITHPPPHPTPVDGIFLHILT